MERFEHWACLPNNTVKFELTVEQVQRLAAENTDPQLSETLGNIVEYLKMREKGRWCFVSMGNPWEERYPNGTNIGKHVEGEVEFVTRNCAITRKGVSVGYITRPKGSRGSNDDGWDVFITPRIGKPYKAGWCGYEGHAYTVKNEGQEDAVRPDLHYAVVTCYLRGVKEKK